MFDIFLMKDIRKLMKNKSIVFLGDSNVRALYKDFLCLLRGSQFISDRTLKTKMENTVFGDRLVYHGERTNARRYREEREASIESTHVSFFFLTKVYDEYVKEVLKKIDAKSNPDVIVVNSCLWDITRWGYDGVKHFKENLNSLMKEFKLFFPDCLVIWVTTPPIACEMKGGFLVKELQFLKYSLRFHVVEANNYARKVVVDNGFDVLDTHFHLNMQIHRRCQDGIHWLPEAVRYITNLLLRHISLSWDVALPHRYEPVSVDENLLASGESTNPAVLETKEKENMADVTQICPEKSSALLESNKNTIKAINKKDETKEKKAPPLHKVPRKEESIHRNMAMNNKKVRHNRIRQWKYSPAIYNPHHANDPIGHPAPETYPPNNNHVPFLSYNSGSSFASNWQCNFSHQSQFQNYGEPYVFPSLQPRQILQPNVNFCNDEIPSNFHF